MLNGMFSETLFIPCCWKENMGIMKRNRGIYVLYTSVYEEITSRLKLVTLAPIQFKTVCLHVYYPETQTLKCILKV